jgi:hypothetical protein
MSQRDWDSLSDRIGGGKRLSLELTNVVRIAAKAVSREGGL